MPATVSQNLESTRGDIGTGIYSLADLRLFLALSGEREDANHATHWLRAALNPVVHRSWQSDYSFSDLVSLFVVRQLRGKGVRPRTIRDAEQYLRSKWKTDRPFAREEIKTDGVEVFCEDDPHLGQIEAAGRGGQQTIRQAVEHGLECIYYMDGNAAYWVPTPGVVVDPRVQFGSPVVKGTRIPTDAVAGVVRQLGLERAVGRFSLTTENIEQAVAFEERIASFN